MCVSSIQEFQCPLTKKIVTPMTAGCGECVRAVWCSQGQLVQVDGQSASDYGPPDELRDCAGL